MCPVDLRLSVAFATITAVGALLPGPPAAAAGALADSTAHRVIENAVVDTLAPVEVTDTFYRRLHRTLASSQGAVTLTELKARPVYRPGELLETVPGVVISQHSGEGKANQYYLRGFNLDHGTDMAIFLAGMPVNIPSHAHGQGYSDLNFLIPELVTGVEYKKGTYYADEGDFGTAGAPTSPTRIASMRRWRNSATTATDTVAACWRVHARSVAATCSERSRCSTMMARGSIPMGTAS